MIIGMILFIIRTVSEPLQRDTQIFMHKQFHNRKVKSYLHRKVIQ